MLPNEVLAALTPNDLAAVWAGSIINPPSDAHRVLVAVEGDEVVGYAAIGPSADADSKPSTSELMALEVHPEHQRAGHGSRLLAACVDTAREMGCTEMTAWCPVSDENRRAFLQSTGWGPDTALRDLAVPSANAGEPQALREARLVTAI